MGKHWAGTLGGGKFKQNTVVLFRTDIQIKLEDTSSGEKTFLNYSLPLALTLSIDAGEILNLYYAKLPSTKETNARGGLADIGTWTPFAARDLETGQALPIGPAPSVPLNFDFVKEVVLGVFFIIIVLFIFGVVSDYFHSDTKLGRPTPQPANHNLQAVPYLPPNDTSTAEPSNAAIPQPDSGGGTSPTEGLPRSTPELTDGAQPTFDCDRATTPSERLICSDRRLASLEVEMVGAFNAALSTLPESQRSRLRREHLEWFRTYARECNSNAIERDDRYRCIETSLTRQRDDLRKRAAGSLTLP